MIVYIVPMLCMSSGILGTKLALILNMGFGIVSELAFRRIAVNDKCYSRHGKHIRLHDSYLDRHGMQKKTLFSPIIYQPLVLP